MKPSIKHVNIPIFIPELACPFQCVFCDQKKITGQNFLLSDKDIIHTIEEHLQSTDVYNSEVQLAFFGGTFTGLNLDDQEYYLGLIQPYLKANSIKGIRISTRPDYINEENLVLLKKYGVTHIELGAQSLVDEVLKASSRGHTVKDVEIASKMILNAGFNLGLQMMIGLPGSSTNNSLITAQKIKEFGASETRIYPTIVIKDTSLAHLFKTGKYIPLTTDEAIEQSAEVFKYFENNGIKVLRVGLYPSDDLTEQGGALAGPEMPHFKEKVLSRIWLDTLKKELDFKSNYKGVMITVAPDEYNFAVGFQASNRKYLEKYFHKMKFKMNTNLKGRDYEVVYS